MNIATLQEKKVTELQEIARSLGIASTYRMTKQELIYQILESFALAAAEEPEREAAGDRAGKRPRKTAVKISTFLPTSTTRSGTTHHSRTFFTTKPQW